MGFIFLIDLNMDDKKVIWNKQSEKDLFNEHVDWTSTYYAVIMKDMRERIVVSYADEGYDGSVNTYYDFYGSDDVVDFDDILLWRETDKPMKAKDKIGKLVGLEPITINEHTKGILVYAKANIANRRDWLVLISHVEVNRPDVLSVVRYISYKLDTGECHWSRMGENWGNIYGYDFYKPTPTHYKMIRDIMKKNNIRYIKALNKLVRIH